MNTNGIVEIESTPNVGSPDASVKEVLAIRLTFGGRRGVVGMNEESEGSINIRGSVREVDQLSFPGIAQESNVRDLLDQTSSQEILSVEVFT